MKQFKGRPVVPGTCTASALVSHGGFNTLASFQNALQFGDKEAKCGDQNNADLFGKPMINTALCLPQTIGSTTGGMVLYCAKAMNRNPACMLFSEHIDSLACAGAVLAAVWTDEPMVTVDCLGQEFLDYQKPYKNHIPLLNNQNTFTADFGLRYFFVTKERLMLHIVQISHPLLGIFNKNYQLSVKTVKFSCKLIYKRL